MLPSPQHSLSLLRPQCRATGKSCFQLLSGLPPPLLHVELDLILEFHRNCLSCLRLSFLPPLPLLLVFSIIHLTLLTDIHAFSYFSLNGLFSVPLSPPVTFLNSVTYSPSVSVFSVSSSPLLL